MSPPTPGKTITTRFLERHSAMASSYPPCVPEKPSYIAKSCQESPTERGSHEKSTLSGAPNHCVFAFTREKNTTNHDGANPFRTQKYTTGQHHSKK